MADQDGANKKPFSFGTTGGSSSGGLFGQNSSGNSNPSPFGGAFGQQATSQAGNAPLFGAPASSAPTVPASTATSIFGSNSSTANPPKLSFGTGQPSLFGGNTPAESSSTTPMPLFGAVSTGATASPFGQSSNGATLTSSTPKITQGAPTASLFGSIPAASTPSASGSWSFSGTTNNNNNSTPASSAGQPGSSMFSLPSTSGPGTSSTPQSKKTTPSLFSTTPAGQPPVSLFGSQATAASQPPSTSEAAAPSLFMSKTPASSAKPASSAPVSSMFSRPAGGAAAPTSGTSASSLFGGQNLDSAAKQPATTSTAPPSSLFAGLGGAAPQPTTSGASGAGLFGAAAASQPPSSGAGATGGLFGGVTSQPPGSSTGGNGGLFGTTNQPASTGAGPDLTTATTGTSVPSFALPASGANSGPSPGIFGGAATTSGNGGAPASTSGPNAAAASTSGAAPPATSRLAQKTMDEVLTSWSTSLATHQKNFQSMAKQVSVWDRTLVENANNITALYGQCFQAEKDCSEVERQLSNVEHSQMDLEALLDKYESEVDHLMETNGLGDGSASIGGIDAERERTYKIAEACASRLTDMSHSLTDMIDEVNRASTQLSSHNPTSQSAAARADDPLAQIVRVLNGHLAQLQTIDTGAATLQSKVSVAQRDARTLSQSQGLNGGGQWADDFGRSYLGRR